VTSKAQALVLSQEIDDEHPDVISETTLRFLYGMGQLDDVIALFMNVTETLLAQLDSVRSIATQLPMKQDLSVEAR
jgi:hypothetical protein